VQGSEEQREKTRTARGLLDKGRRESLTRFGAKTTKVKEEFM
jgi:hypothetical protein